MAAVTHLPCQKHCSVCEGQDHHWMEECTDDDGEPVEPRWACKHCPATKPYEDEFDGEDECDHLEYDLDILTGRATCDHCDHRWFMSDAELESDQKRRQMPYEPEEDTIT